MDAAARIAELEELVRRQRSEIRTMQAVAERKNIELTALHHVWCSGPCGASLNAKIVEAAIDNTDRMITKYNGQQSNRAWRRLHEYPEKQAALVTSWRHHRRELDDIYRKLKAARDRWAISSHPHVYEIIKMLEAIVPEYIWKQKTP